MGGGMDHILDKIFFFFIFSNTFENGKDVFKNVQTFKNAYSYYFATLRKKQILAAI